VGSAIVRPSIETGEQLQGFAAGWTSHVAREGVRWKLVGNAVSVPVAEWIGHRLAAPRNAIADLATPMTGGQRWPSAASGVRGERTAWNVSERPLSVKPRRSLSSILDLHGSRPLSHRATAGFASRLARSSLRTSEEFRASLTDHVSYMSTYSA
jgi:DNA (cytosine-5)-methyltransferase 1